jgi:hypothetical protein
MERLAETGGHDARARFQFPAFAQIGGRRHDYQFRVLELSRDETRVLRRTPPNREVEAFVRKVDVAIAQMRFDGDTGVTLAEVCKQR